jgi:hypothetical protein
MSKHAVVVLYVLGLVAVVVGVDVLFFRNPNMLSLSNVPLLGATGGRSWARPAPDVRIAGLCSWVMRSSGPDGEAEDPRGRHRAPRGR